MSRYAILVIINLPIITLGILSATVGFKLGKISRKKLLLQILFWVVIFAGLASAETFYQYLFSNNLTETEPLSLFDVIQITAIIGTLYLLSRSIARAEMLERRLSQLHQEMAIRLSAAKKRP